MSHLSHFRQGPQCLCPLYYYLSFSFHFSFNAFSFLWNSAISSFVIVDPDYEVKLKNGKKKHIIMLTASIITDINEFNMGNT